MEGSDLNLDDLLLFAGEVAEHVDDSGFEVWAARAGEASAGCGKYVLLRDPKDFGELLKCLSAWTSSGAPFASHPAADG
jgi:hypothetical protein